MHSFFTRRPRRLAVAGLAVVAAALAGCTPAPTTVGPTGEPEPEATLRLGIPLAPENMDIRHTAGVALEQILIDNVYEGLVARTAENEIVPALSTEYEVSPDGLQYTFTLNQDVKFHGGGDLTASDVVWSYNAVREDEALRGHAELAHVVSVEAPDEHTVVLTLDAPDQNLLFWLTGPAGLVFDEGDETDLRTAANGTGPFRLDDFAKGVGATLTRFDEYWGEASGVAAVEVSYIPDSTAALNAVLDGSVDVFNRILPEFAPEIEGVNGFTVTRGRSTSEGTLAFNNAVAPFDDVRVREALRRAIDHDALVEALGGGTVLYGPVPELDPGFEDLTGVADYDPEAARELLADAGQDDLTLELTIPNHYSTTIATYLVSAFHDIGVELTVNTVEFSTWIDDVYTNKDYQLSFVEHAEPRDFANYANPGYYFGYDNPEVQELYAEAISAVDAAESAELIAQAARIVSEDHAADWLYAAEEITAVGPGVEGFPVDSTTSRIDLSAVTLATE